MRLELSVGTIKFDLKTLIFRMNLSENGNWSYLLKKENIKDSILHMVMSCDKIFLLVSKILTICGIGHCQGLDCAIAATREALMKNLH